MTFFLVRKVKLGKITSIEAENGMHTQFGSNPIMWSLHGIVLQVPSVPPRPL